MHPNFLQALVRKTRAKRITLADVATCRGPARGVTVQDIERDGMGAERVQLCPILVRPSHGGHAVSSRSPPTGGCTNDSFFSQDTLAVQLDEVRQARW